MRVLGINNNNLFLYDGKLASAIDKFHVFRGADGRYVLNLSKAEKTWVIKQLGISEDDLNTNITNNPYLKALYTEMPKAGLRLDIAQAKDLLIDRLLQGYSNVIAPDLASKKKKVSYRYVRVFAEDELEVELAASDTKKTAYKLLGKLEDSREQMIMYLLNEGKKIHPSIDDRKLRGEVNKRMELSHGKFVAALEDPLFLEKGMLNMGVIVGVVDFRSNLYFYEGQPLAPEGEPATLINASIYLQDKKQGPIRVALSKETLDAFNKRKK
jgi:hypothetical protein